MIHSFNKFIKTLNESTLMSPLPVFNVTHPFGEPRSSAPHNGVDLATASGTPVSSPADGEVIVANINGNSIVGGTIRIKHANDIITGYCHIKQVDVSTGDQVKQGQVIGLSGGGADDIGKGNSTGPHLHFTVTVNNEVVDPAEYIDKLNLPQSTKTAGGDEVLINADLIKRLIEKLKEKNFSQSDLDKSAKSTTSGGSQSTGNIDISSGNFDTNQKENISLLISSMTDKGITDPLTQIGILSVISKECNFKPKSEVGYDTTSNSRIKGIFGSRVSSLSDSELDALKSKPEDFFNLVYANIIGNGPVSSGDGYLYRGRGFNQLTGRANYKKYGNIIGKDLVGNPDLVNDPKVAAEIAIAFATKGKPASSFPTFTDKTDAAEFFADVNAGGGVSSHRSNAVAASDKFSIA
jgi:predicted chitinase